MKKEFIEFLNALIAAAPDVAEELMTDNVRSYIDALSDKTTEKPEITENGKLILKWLQSAPTAPYKSKDIAEQLFVSSRTVSGGMRKLTTDGFVEKVGEAPVLYIITEKGKNYKFED